MIIIKNLEALLGKGQDNALLRFGLSNACLNEKKYTQAAEHAKKALEFDAHYTAAWKLYGKALEGLGEIEKALEAYQQGIKVAEEKGDKQAAKEMQVFCKKLNKSK